MDNERPIIDFHLDSIAEVNRKTLQHALDLHYEHSYGTFVDTDFKLDDPKVVEFIGTITTILNNGIPSSDAEHVGQQAFFFGFMLGSLLLPEAHECFKSAYFDFLSSHPDDNSLITMTQDYIQNRPTLDGFIGAYIFELDPTAQYPHVAEVIATLVFMLMEVESKNILIEDQVSKLMDEIADL